MRRFLTIIMIACTIFVQAQTDTLKVIEIKPLDTVCYGYVLDTNVNEYQRVFCFWDDLQPELNNFINLAKNDYLADNDTITRILYNNTSTSLQGKQRFYIQSAKGASIVLYMDGLSPELQYSIYVFGREYMNTYYQGKFYR